MLYSGFVPFGRMVHTNMADAVVRRGVGESGKMLVIILSMGIMKVEMGSAGGKTP